MKIIISPAKKMNIEGDLITATGQPVFYKESQIVYQVLKKMTLAQLIKLWGCNEKIAGLNFRRLQEMETMKAVTPALLSYEGIQYQYMAPRVFAKQQWDYVQRHLRILSGFYGVLRPCDPILPYRLEMQAQLAVDQHQSLYQFWGNKLYQEVKKEDGIILNLASKEYSRAIEPYLTKEETLISCIFGEMIDGKVKTKATQAKMARGEMVRWMSEHQITSLNDLKDFHEMDYRYSIAHSNDTTYVFIKNPSEMVKV